MVLYGANAKIGPVLVHYKTRSYDHTGSENRFFLGRAHYAGATPRRIPLKNPL